MRSQHKNPGAFAGRSMPAPLVWALEFFLPRGRLLRRFLRRRPFLRRGIPLLLSLLRLNMCRIKGEEALFQGGGQINVMESSFEANPGLELPRIFRCCRSFFPFLPGRGSPPKANVKYG